MSQYFPHVPRPEPERDSAVLGILAAVIVALIGGVVYGVVGGTIHFEIGWAAFGVGFLTGYVAGKAGGANPVLQAAAAVFSIGGVYLGELVIAALISSQDLNIPLTEIFLSHSALVDETWDVIFRDMYTVLFFALAAAGAVAGVRKGGAR
ncbi:hypothetical protein ACGFMM_12680 [Streptomyces sp. NPDC048604]|uniref:hypothetical protein n=1 Tax=Streptomyces sp. NPDC048604 TaxID=3365578 RepID=UPI003715B905